MCFQKICKRNFLGLLILGIGWMGGVERGYSWEDAYTGEEATGEHVLGLWQFSPGSEGNDSSTRGNILELRGADTEVVPDGKFTGALKVGEYQEPGDNRQGGTIANNSALNPEGPFSAEMWIQPDASMGGKTVVTLLDKKYLYRNNDAANNHQGYMMRLRKVGGKQDTWSILVELGFGDDSAVVTSSQQVFEPGQWYHVAFSYDGAGYCRIYVNGQIVGEAMLEGREAIATGEWPLVIGDRIGSTTNRFLGKISEVRLTTSPALFE